jgi:hypothetical protein
VSLGRQGICSGSGKARVRSRGCLRTRWDVRRPWRHSSMSTRVGTLDTVSSVMLPSPSMGFGFTDENTLALHTISQIMIVPCCSIRRVANCNRRSRLQTRRSRIRSDQAHSGDVHTLDLRVPLIRNRDHDGKRLTNAAPLRCVIAS